MTDEQITAALAEVGAAWLMDEADEHCQANAMRHLVAAAVAAERERWESEAMWMADEADGRFLMNGTVGFWLRKLVHNVMTGRAAATHPAPTNPKETP